MKRRTMCMSLVGTLGVLVPIGAASGQTEMGTAFTYQGFLEDQIEGPVTGDCVFMFSVWDDPSDGNELASTRIEDVPVRGGLFTVHVDFGSDPFGGDARWLGMAVCCPSPSCIPLPLDHRQKLTPAPHALALPGLRTQQNPTSPNLIGGYSGNIVDGAVGATIGGGGIFQDEGYQCSNPPPTLCETDDDCPDGAGPCLPGAAGTCTAEPILCEDDDDCPSGDGTCLLDPFVGRCSIHGWILCFDVGDCPAGETCDLDGTVGMCTDVPSILCLSNDDCPGDETCQLETAGMCSSPLPVWCEVDEDCPPGGTCLPDPVYSDGQNRVTGDFGTVAGGVGNVAGEAASGRARGKYATVGGGKDNDAVGDYSTVSGGRHSWADGNHATIGGGQTNETSGKWATIGGGRRNKAAYRAVVAGGYENRAQGSGSTIGGGKEHYADGDESTIGGGVHHIATGSHSTIGGGYYNYAGGSYSTVAGGEENDAGGPRSTVAGGYENSADGSHSTVGGGYKNKADARYSTVAGGYENDVTYSGNVSTIAGGYKNKIINGLGSIIAGGFDNTTEADYSAILGGEDNYLYPNATYSMAFGRNVSVSDSYSMAFGRSVAVNNAYRVALFKDMYPGRLGINRDGTIDHPIHVGTWLNTVNGNGAFLSGAGVWGLPSGRTVKENFQPVAGKDLMARIRSLPVESWEYKGTGERHIGPCAEDFQDAFDVGVLKEDGTRERQYLAAVDVAGVALAGVKAIDRIVKEKDARIAELEARLAALERAVRLNDHRVQGAGSAGPDGAMIAAALALLGLTGFMMRAHSRRGGVR